MTLKNRVDPFGSLHAEPIRGTWMGNRGGCFHRSDQTLRLQHWVSQRWIYCLTQFKGRQRTVMKPGNYTELFFLDEATALAAGHRPCWECQRDRANEFRKLLIQSGILTSGSRAPDLDARIAGEVQRRLNGLTDLKPVESESLPNGAMFERDGAAYLKWHDEVWRWSFQGYSPAGLVKSGRLLTPAATVCALDLGFVPQLHDSIDLF